MCGDGVALQYREAAAFLNFIAQPEQALFWSTVTGYIPVTKTGFEYMKAHGFYDKAPYKGREAAIDSLSSYESNGPGGIRLGNFLQVRAEVGNGLQEIFAGKASVQDGLDGVVQRGNTILHRFQDSSQGNTQP